MILMYGRWSFVRIILITTTTHTPAGIAVVVIGIYRTTTGSRATSRRHVIRTSSGGGSTTGRCHTYLRFGRWSSTSTSSDHGCYLPVLRVVV